MFTLVGLRLETVFNNLPKSDLLLFCYVVNLVPKNHLLESNERHVWVVFAGDDASIFLEDNFIARLIKSPVTKELFIELWASFAVVNGIRLSERERCDFPPRFHESYGFSLDVQDLTLGCFFVVVEPLADSLGSTFSCWNE